MGREKRIELLARSDHVESRLGAAVRQVIADASKCFGGGVDAAMFAPPLVEVRGIRAPEPPVLSQREIPLFFAHSLHADEQKQVFGSAPWIFRRVIFPLMDRRAFPRFREFAVSPMINA